MELALSVEVLPGFLEVHLGNRLLGSGSQAVGNLVDGDGFLVRPGGKSESPQPASRPQIQKKGSYCVSGGSIGEYHPKLLCDGHLWRDFLRSRHLL